MPKNQHMTGLAAFGLLVTIATIYLAVIEALQVVIVVCFIVGLMSLIALFVAIALVGLFEFNWTALLYPAIPLVICIVLGVLSSVLLSAMTETDTGKTLTVSSQSLVGVNDKLNEVCQTVLLESLRSLSPKIITYEYRNLTTDSTCPMNYTEHVPVPVYYMQTVDGRNITALRVLNERKASCTDGKCMPKREIVNDAYNFTINFDITYDSISRDSHNAVSKRQRFEYHNLSISKKGVITITGELDFSPSDNASVAEIDPSTINFTILPNDHILRLNYSRYVDENRTRNVPCSITRTVQITHETVDPRASNYAKMFLAVADWMGKSCIDIVTEASVVQTRSRYSE